MERYAMNEDRAFAFLVRASSHRNIKLRNVAQELVNERTDGSRSPRCAASTHPDLAATSARILSFGDSH